MNPALRLRCLTRTDLPFADLVRSLEGWNQTMCDWERFLAMEPDGCFLAEWDGALAGTATTIIYGPELAWIGMVLVHPEFRQRGIGRALLQRCIEHLRSRGVGCIKLDATPAGKTVYAGMGFQDEWTLTRWERTPGHRQTTTSGHGLRNWREADLSAIDELDATAFGVSRRRLLQALTEQSSSTLVLERELETLDGYGFLRDGSRAFYLGPVVAHSTDLALRLVGVPLERSDGKGIFWDIPDRHRVAVSWAEANGFTAQRSLTRMFLGENAAPGDPEKIFAIAGPEVG